MKTALLFDLDGTLIDSDALHLQVFADMLAPRGVTIDDALFAEHIHGKSNRYIFSVLCPGEDADAWSDRKEAEFRRRLGGGVPQVAGTVALLDLAEAQGWPVAVVTNAPRENAEASLTAIGLRDRFDTIVLGDECARAKPEPDPYLEALRLLGADAAASLAFEDSPTGVQSAVAAGIPTVGRRSLLDDATLRALGASLTIDTFADPALTSLVEKLKGLPA
jgi:beta-phosphoglucomutase